MNDLQAIPGESRQALDRIVAGPEPHHEPWTSVAGLELVGIAPETIESLIAGGWLERWTVGKADCVTLTPLGAERLGVRLDERWTAAVESFAWEEVDKATGKTVRRSGRRRCWVEEPRWRNGLPEPIDDVRPIREPTHPQFRQAADWLLERIPSLAADPVEEAILREEAQRDQGDVVAVRDGKPFTLFGGVPVRLDRSPKANRPGRP